MTWGEVWEKWPVGGAALVQDDEALYILNCTHNFYA